MSNYAEARAALLGMVRYLERVNPSAARSWEEGVEETLTLHRLGAPEGKSAPTPGRHGLNIRVGWCIIENGPGQE